MSLNDTPSGERKRIGFFGMRNAGKSSLVNAVTGQDLAVVSDTLGTTTDLVEKAMELLPLGPVVIVDSPGIDDEGELGAQRVARATRLLRSCDVAVLVVDAAVGLQGPDKELLGTLAQRSVPHVLAWNKADLLPEQERERRSAQLGGLCEKAAGPRPQGADGEATPLSTAATTAAAATTTTNAAAATTTAVFVSAQTGEGVGELKEAVARAAAQQGRPKRVVADLLSPGDSVVLVVPIDASAPKGRIILPQQMVLRDVLDAHALASVCQPQELACLLREMASPPALVITDSQALEAVAAIMPQSVPLTTFSVLMARYKGDLEELTAGASRLAALTATSRVLIAEGCTHHRQCEDIGTVKIPRWVEEHCGQRPEFQFTSGRGFPDDLSAFDLVIHCGGCMLNEREMARRMEACASSGVAMVNYGTAIAQMHGVLERTLAPFAHEVL